MIIFLKKLSESFFSETDNNVAKSTEASVPRVIRVQHNRHFRTETKLDHFEE